MNILIRSLALVSLAFALSSVAGSAFASQDDKAPAHKKELVPLTAENEKTIAKALKDNNKQQMQFPQSILGGGGASTDKVNICCATAGDYGVICWRC